MVFVLADLPGPSGCWFSSSLCHLCFAVDPPTDKQAGAHPHYDRITSKMKPALCVICESPT
ncbi:unnamed protein product [Amoebophrya sp. A25]|nr:unnamed protein product [Amoebophrya sp. A25]|eukprot:GSA25T00011844001.1